MAKGEKAKDLFTASEVARFCQVDLKTIHNWAERGEVRHFRTPGRHLRFRRVDVLDFLRKYGYPIPDDLQQGKPRVLVLEDDARGAAETEKALQDDFEVESHTDPVCALLSIGAEAPDAVIVDDRVGSLDGVHIIDCIHAAEPTRHVRTVLFSNDSARKRDAMDHGASAHVERPDRTQLRDTLEALMGLER
ncbi:MAG: helix-turn-helix domain-containing protein [Myxococcota bacterium]